MHHISHTCPKRYQDDPNDRASYAELVRLNIAMLDYRSVLLQEKWKWSFADDGLAVFNRAEAQAHEFMDRLSSARCRLIDARIDEVEGERWLRQGRSEWDGKSAYEMLETQDGTARVFAAIQSQEAGISCISPTK